MRFSDETNGRKPKPRPDGFSKRKCFINFLEVFGSGEIHVIADCVKPDTAAWLESKSVIVHKTSFGNGGESFLFAIDLALKTAQAEGEVVYLVEDDYLHLPGSGEVLEEGLEFSDYSTLYDHPDKYGGGRAGARKLISGRSEVTRLYRSKSIHWKLTNSTTLTFASRIHCLRADYAAYRRYCGDEKSRDFAMFTHLRRRRPFGKGRRIASSVPGLSTHVHLPWISPNPAIYAALEKMRTSEER